MSIFNDFEREYIRDTHLLLESFDISNFISNAKSNLSGKFETLKVNWKIDYYTHILEKSIENFSGININKVAINDFINAYNKSNKVPIKIEDISESNVSVIKPQYISQYVVLIQKLLDKVREGNIDHSDITKFISPDIPNKIKRQTVKTTLDSLTVQDVIKETTPNIITVDEDYINCNILPFITNFDTKKKTLLVEANAVLNTIKETELSIKDITETLNALKSSESIDSLNIKYLNYIYYESIRGLFDVLSYVVFMEIRKLNAFSNNVLTCNKLYDSLIITNISEGYEDDIIVAMMLIH